MYVCVLRFIQWSVSGSLDVGFIFMGLENIIVNYCIIYIFISVAREFSMNCRFFPFGKRLLHVEVNKVFLLFLHGELECQLGGYHGLRQM